MEISSAPYFEILWRMGNIQLQVSSSCIRRQYDEWSTWTKLNVTSMDE